MNNRQPSQGGAGPFYYFDEKAVLHIPSLALSVERGEVVSLLGIKGTDISYIYGRFNQENPIQQRRAARFPGRRRPGGAPGAPFIYCVTRKINLFFNYSAYDNFLMSEKCVLPHGKKRLVELCGEIKRRFGLDIDFGVPLKNLRISDKIMVDVVRAYLIDADVYVFDNLFSLLELHHRNIFAAIAGDLSARGKRILYLTTRWEDAVVISSRAVVFMDNAVVGEVDTESVKKNPQHLIYLMSGKTLVEQHSEQAETGELLNMLYTGAEYLVDNYELADALKFVARNVAKALRCEGATIYLRDDTTAQLHAFSNLSNPSSVRLSDEFLRFRMNNDKKDSLFYATAEDPNFEGFFLSGGGDVKTIISVPVFGRAGIQGLLVLTYGALFVYESKQVLYLKSFVKEIAIVIETSQLMGSSVLLQESNHRIKNNLQIIINLIAMQQLYARERGGSDTDGALNSIIGRVKNIANVHEMLTSQSAHEAAIDLKRIIRSVLRAFDLSNISVEVEADHILIPYSKATSISMVINELITNAVKYAFEGTADNLIKVVCRREKDNICICVEDNGKGIDEGFSLQDTLSIGFSIIRTIVRIDLRGSIDIRNSGHGTIARIVIPSCL